MERHFINILPAIEYTLNMYIALGIILFVGEKGL